MPPNLFHKLEKRFKKRRRAARFKWIGIALVIGSLVGFTGSHALFVHFVALGVTQCRFWVAAIDVASIVAGVFGVFLLFTRVRV